MCNLPIPRDNREVTNSEGYRYHIHKACAPTAGARHSSADGNWRPWEHKCCMTRGWTENYSFWENHRMWSIRNKSSYFSQWKKGGTFWKTIQRILLKIDSELGQVPTRLQCYLSKAPLETTEGASDTQQTTLERQTVNAQDGAKRNFFFKTMFKGNL